MSSVADPVEERSGHPIHSQFAVRVLLATVTLALAMFAAMGTYTRFFADDFTYGSTGPLLRALRESYLNWNGRFAATLAICVLTRSGPELARILPALAMGLWFAALTWALLELLRDTGHTLRSAAGLAAVILFSILSTTLSRGQSLYWETGMLTYTAPLILGTATFAFAVRCYRTVRSMSASRMASLALLAIVVGGFSETTTALEIGAAVAAVVLSRRILDSEKRARAAKVAAAVLIGSLAAIAILAASPGNAIRQSSSGVNPSVWYALSLPGAFAGMLIGRSFLVHPLATLLPFGLAALMARDVCPEGQALRNVSKVGATLLAFLLLAVAFAPAAYALRWWPPSRAMIAPQFVLVTAMALLGYIVGSNPRGRLWTLSPRVVTWALLVLSVAPIASIGWTIKESQSASIYARAWDRRDAELRSAAARGLPSVTCAALPEDIALVRGLEVPEADPDSTVNQVMASYYQLKQIRIVGEASLETREEWQHEWTTKLYYRLRSRLLDHK